MKWLFAVVGAAAASLASTVLAGWLYLLYYMKKHGIADRALLKDDFGLAFDMTLVVTSVFVVGLFLFTYLFRPRKHA